MRREGTDRYPALALDTSSTVLDIALFLDGDIDRETIRAGRRHNELLAPALRRILERNSLSARDLSIIACTIGPGSFTGLRIGLSTAKGLYATTHSCRLVGVPTLDAYARAAYRLDDASNWPHPGYVLCAIDGRKQRYYAGLYRSDERIWGPSDCLPAEIVDRVHELSTGPVFLVGPDSETFLATVAGIESGISGSSTKLEPLPAYERGVAPAVLDIAVSDSDRTLDLPENAGPVYLRGSQAEE